MIRKTMMALAATAAISLTASAQNGTVKIGDFSAGLDEWTYSNGQEFPGAEGNLWHDEGRKAAVLEGTFEKGGAYVAMVKGLSEQLNLKDVTIKLTTSDVKSIVFRITDSTNQTFQQRIDLGDASKGVSVTVKSFTGGNGAGSWGGANDGKWHAPAKGVSIVLDKGHLNDPVNSPKGKLLIESIEGKLAQ